MYKTAYEWANEFGIRILDPDGFGERHTDRPLMTDVMDKRTFNKCVAVSTVQILDNTLFKEFVGG